MNSNVHFTGNKVNNCFRIYHNSELQEIPRLETFLRNLSFSTQYSKEIECIAQKFFITLQNCLFSIYTLFLVTNQINIKWSLLTQFSESQFHLLHYRTVSRGL